MPSWQIKMTAEMSVSRVLLLSQDASRTNALCTDHCLYWKVKQPTSRLCVITPNSYHPDGSNSTLWYKMLLFLKKKAFKLVQWLFILSPCIQYTHTVNSFVLRFMYFFFCKQYQKSFICFVLKVAWHNFSVLMTLHIFGAKCYLHDFLDQWIQRIQKGTGLTSIRTVET